MTLHTRLSGDDVVLQPLATDFARFRRRVIFECFKWDPQVDDTVTVSDHACILSEATATHLEKLAQALAAETLALEDALLARPDLHRELGIRPRLRRALSREKCGQAVRVMRFDFHPTADGGWALSEVNSDVPGGFAEASALPTVAAAHVSGAGPRGDTAAAMVDAMLRRLDAGARLAFVHATAYADDRQVMAFLASRFTQAGFACTLAGPDQLRWTGGKPYMANDALDGIVRFFPADWLTALPTASGWQGYFDNHTLACNPVRAVLSQSKRCPLVWDRLKLGLPNWRALLPETRDPRDAPWQRDENWLIKPAFGRVGEGIAWRGGVSRKTWLRTQWKTLVAPRQWLAQRRFTSRPLATKQGPRHLCIGVFTVDGNPAGFYGRLSAQPTIERHAQDIAVLVREKQT